MANVHDPKKWCVLPLMEMALKDAEASKVLYDNGYYPQAVFYLQQAIEKGLKVIYVQLNYVRCKDLGKKLSHYLIERTPDIISEYYKSKIEGLFRTYNFPENLKTLNFPEILKSELQSFLEKEMKKLKKIVNFYGGLSYKDFLENEKTLDRIIEECSNEGSSFLEKEKEKALNSIVNLFVDVIKKIPPQKTKSGKIEIVIKHAVTEETRKKIKRRLEGYLEGMGGFLEEIFPNYESFKVLFLLYTIFEKHVSTTRYPKKPKIGPSMYTKDKALIKRFPELQRIAKNTIEDFRTLLKTKGCLFNELKNK